MAEGAYGLDLAFINTLHNKPSLQKISPPPDAKAIDEEALDSRYMLCNAGCILDYSRFDFHVARRLRQWDLIAKGQKPEWTQEAHHP